MYNKIKLQISTMTNKRKRNDLTSLQKKEIVWYKEDHPDAKIETM